MVSTWLGVEKSGLHKSFEQQGGGVGKMVGSKEKWLGVEKSGLNLVESREKWSPHN